MLKRWGHLAGIALAFGAMHVAAPSFASDDEILVPASETTCAFGAWLDEREGREVAVRSAPSQDAPVLGTLPGTPTGDTQYEYPVQFDLVAAQGGWVKIARANDDDNLNAEAPPRPVFQGEGWIPSKLARVGIQSGRGFAGPSAASRRVLDFPGQWLTEVATIEAILGCEREWILLEASIGPLLDPDGMPIPPEKRQTVTRRAWFRGVCSNPQTTCDMPSVDAEPPK